MTKKNEFTERKDRFESFLESMKGMGHDNLVKVLQEGHVACFEALEQRYLVRMEFYVNEYSFDDAVAKVKSMSKSMTNIVNVTIKKKPFADSTEYNEISIA